MITLIKKSVEQPITVAVGVVLALLAGAVAFSQVPIQLAPEVSSTVVAVETQWPNATPSEIEADIIEQQEDALSDINNLQSMISTARLGSAALRLEFRTGTDIDAAVALVDQKLAQVPFYPDGVSNPTIDGRDPESIGLVLAVPILTFRRQRLVILWIAKYGHVSSAFLAFQKQAFAVVAIPRS